MADHEHQKHISDSEEDSIMEEREEREEKVEKVEKGEIEEKEEKEEGLDQSSDHESVRLYSLPTSNPLFGLSSRVAQQLYLL